MKKIVLLLCAIVVAQGFRGSLYASEHLVDVAPVSVRDIAAKSSTVKHLEMVDFRRTKPSIAFKSRSLGVSPERSPLSTEVHLQPVTVDDSMMLVAHEKHVDVKGLDELPHEYPAIDASRDKEAQQKMQQARKRVLERVKQLSTDQIAFTRDISAMDWLPREFKQPLVEQGRQLQRLIELSKELSSATGSDITQAQHRVEEQLDLVEQGFVSVEKVLSKYKDFTSLQKLAVRHGLDVGGEGSMHLVDYPEGQRPLELLAKQSDALAKTEPVTRVSSPVKQEVSTSNPFDTDPLGESIDMSKIAHDDGPPTEEDVLYQGGDTPETVSIRKPKKSTLAQEQSEVRATTSWVRTLKWAVTGLTAVVAAYHVAKVVTAKPADLAATASTVTDTVAPARSSDDPYRLSMFLGK